MRRATVECETERQHAVTIDCSSRVSSAVPPIDHRVVKAAVLGQDGLLLFQHESFLAQDAGEKGGPGQRTRYDPEILTAGVCRHDDEGDARMVVMVTVRILRIMLSSNIPLARKATGWGLW